MAVPLPPSPNTLKLTFKGTYGLAKWNNVLHAHMTGAAPTVADLNTLAGDLAVLFGADMLFISSVGLSLTETDVLDIGTVDSSGNPIGNQGVDTTTHVGGGSGTQLPASVAMVVSWRIARHYRGGHPRSYISGQTSTNQLDSQHWSGGQTATLLAKVTTFRTSVNALTTPTTGVLTLGSVSYFKGHDSSGKPILRPSPIFDPFLGEHIDSRIDSQRRRLGKSTG